jgi:hypothetical protein
VPPKVKVFASKAATNALATEVNKRQRNVNVTGICKICCTENEDIVHALTRCPHASSLWVTMRGIWHIPAASQLQFSSMKWMQSALNLILASMVDMFLLVAWRAWYARNEVTHAKPLPFTEGSKRFLVGYLNTLRNIKHLSTEEIIKGKILIGTGAIASTVHHPTLSPVKRWQTPRLGWVKLNIDGSVKLEDGTACTDVVLRDELGQVILCAR